MKEIADKIRQEHQALAECRAVLLQRMEAVRSHPSENDRRALIEELPAFRGHLLKHFAYEEDGGFLSGVLDQCPHLDAQVERLRSEHDWIRDEMTALCAAPTNPTPQQLDSFLGRLGSLLRLLTEHEHTEDTLVLDTLWQDLGVKD